MKPSNNIRRDLWITITLQVIILIILVGGAFILRARWIAGLVLPVILLLFRKIRKPVPMLIIAVIMFAAAWIKRLIIVAPPQAHPNLPVQFVPEEWFVYRPTLIESGITLGSFVMVLIIITLLSKLFPVIPIVDTIREENKNIASET